MTDAQGSSIAAADWLPVQESVFRGLNHALSNRLSSISAIAMLCDTPGSFDERMHAALTADAEHLGEILALYRSLPTEPAPRRDAVRFADALGKAHHLLVEHPECRDVTFAVTEEGSVEPVTLFGKDALKASVLLLLPVARAASGKGRVDVTLRAEDGWLVITARGSKPVDAARSAEFAALGRFAAAEGGNAKAPPEGDALVLTLPGLTRQRR